MEYTLDTELEQKKSKEEKIDEQPGGPDEQKTDTVKEYGQMYMPQQGAPKPKNPRGSISYLTIIGHIEGHITMPPNNKTTKYEHVIPQLINVEENPEIEGLLIILNTVGGDVEAGLALSELISNIGKPTVSLVLGGGHSIGVPLAVSAKQSFIAPSAAMTIHPVRMSGVVVGAQQTYDYFNKMQERVLDFIVTNSGISKRRLKEIMLDTEKLALDVGTILVGEEAVKEKLIDEVGGLNDAMECLYQSIAENREQTKNKQPVTLS